MSNIGNQMINQEKIARILAILAHGEDSYWKDFVSQAEAFIRLSK